MPTPLHPSSNTNSATTTASQPSRRAFLKYVGFGTGAVFAGSFFGPLSSATAQTVSRMNPRAWVDADGVPLWKSVAYPLPLPGDPQPIGEDASRLANYEVIDDLQLPPGFRYDVVCQYGDVFGPPGHEVIVGFNHDYTGLIPIAGTTDEYFLIVNHEYISGRTWLAGNPVRFPEPWLPLAIDMADPKSADHPDIDFYQELCQVFIGLLGVTVLHVRRDASGKIAVIHDSDRHFRITGIFTQNIPDAATKLTFTGPAAPFLGQARGTFANCSGATTPWGTFLTCEENFQDQVPEFITATGARLGRGGCVFKVVQDKSNHPHPFEFEGLGTGVTPPLDGRQYGWVCEVDPVNRTLKKHTSLGRFRHENVALRVEAGKPLVAYMGDDRRGGHVWKYVSDDIVRDPKDPANSRLFEKGTLHVGRWDEKFTGEWVPLRRDTLLRMPEPQHTVGGNVWLPRRENAQFDMTGGHVAVGKGNDGVWTPQKWIDALLNWPYGNAGEGGKLDGLTLERLTMGTRALMGEEDDLRRQGVILMDAYAMANAVGGTPTARPEDIEVHPVDHSVYIAFTDSYGADEGSPDVRIFPDSAGKNSRQYGAVYRLAEDNGDPASRTFTWGKFVSSGEASEGGGGFACADNLAFDPEANLWMVCDITTPMSNNAVDRAPKTAPGETGFVGVFGNNAMFMIPTQGPRAGQPHCFAIGPMECELTGPTFTPDGRTLLVSVQHPGEFHGRRPAGQTDATTKPELMDQRPRTAVRTMHLAARDGTLFQQRRIVPLGSNFPGNKPGDVPLPCVVCITRSQP